MSSWTNDMRRRLDAVEGALRAYVAGVPLPPSLNPLGLAGESDMLCSLLEREADRGLPYYIAGCGTMTPSTPPRVPVHAPRNGR